MEAAKGADDPVVPRFVFSLHPLIALEDMLNLLRQSPPPCHRPISPPEWHHNGCSEEVCCGAGGRGRRWTSISRAQSTGDTWRYH